LYDISIELENKYLYIFNRIKKNDVFKIS
jgi:hypothetical protein